MNWVSDEIRRSDSRIFDRLADGELSPSEERALLAALDDEPGAWRRCALAFIEAQALGRDLAGWPAEQRSNSRQQDPHAAPVCLGDSRAELVTVRRRSAGRAALVAAACLAFALGIWTAVARPFAGHAGDMGQVAKHEHSSTASAAGASTAPNDGGPDWPETGDAGPAADTVLASGTVRLRFTGAAPDSVEDIELPFISVANIDPNWLEEQPSAIPAGVLDTWRKAGHVVKQHRELWPIDLDDGRQVLLPVEQVEIDYAAERNVY